MPGKGGGKGATPKRTRVETLKHGAAKRRNIPTAELQSYVADDEAAPKRMLYPRNPDLDPQLVRRGKDEQDAGPLAVDTVPIYIQEKINPKAIVEDVRRVARKEAEPQADLFGDFNGLHDPEAKLEFYVHDQNWSNRMILGDSLLVMNSLAEKEGLKGRIQMIYMDPPYGISFRSNWQPSTRKKNVTDASTDVSREPEVIQAFRDTWALGVHSYLAYLRDRLVVARELLTESGSVFVQIGDQNVHLVRAVLDEVFGPSNAVVTILVKKKGAQQSSMIDPVNDYLLWYSKNIRSDGKVKFRNIFEERILDSDSVREFSTIVLEYDHEVDVTDLHRPNGERFDYVLRPQQIFLDYQNAEIFRANPLQSGGERTNQSLPFTFHGRKFPIEPGNSWKHTVRAPDDELSGMSRLAEAGRLVVGRNQLRFRSYFSDFPYKKLSNWWGGLGGASKPVYVVQTNEEIVKRCLLLTTDPGDLVLDPTCGSGTTAYVAEQWGRRWVTIDYSRVAMTLARTRLMAARYPYYLLRDSREGLAKEAELTNRPA